MRPTNAEEQSKVLRAKRKHVMKEIEEWATQNLTVDLNQGNTRMSGKNDDTVTEIRMLKTRLLDLGVERYKFLNNYSTEKQKMLELKKRKQQTLKNIRSYSAMSEPIHWRPSTSSSQPSTIPERASEVGSVIVGRYYPTDQPYGEEIRNVANANQNMRQNSPQRNGLSRAKTVQFIHSGLEKSDRDSRTVKSEPHPPSALGYRAHSVKDNASVVSFRPRSGMTDSSDGRSWASRRSRISKFGGSVPSVTGDSRYALLEKALSSNYEKNSKLPVGDIVKKIGSLHVPPKNFKEKKPKWEIKIQAFKREAGITW
ncbi:hypothetical protein FSP39_009511 [Pinctada imbricata]|uniref:Uncharacterized protein n=1 Tax=Pinctada imbricata TaxID=66713 RepID=A0AA88XQ39_PINIB|nr:hypothetical protein FSP39_009511 [Pinctada imbricata]